MQQPGAQPGWWPYPYPPPIIRVNPQIQVQVNPRAKVVAEPKADASANANAKTDVQANPSSSAAASIESSAGAPAAAPPPAPPPIAPAPPASFGPAPVDAGPSADFLRPRRGALITGLVLGGFSYGFSAFAGYKLRAGCGTSNDFVGCRRTANNMFIPIAGPAMNVPAHEGGSTRFALAFASGAQATGALLTVIGAVMLHRDLRHNRDVSRRALAVGPAPGGLQLGGRF
jgi:hypothetical protein